MRGAWMRAYRRTRPEMEWDTLFKRAPQKKSSEVCAACFRSRLGGEYSCPCGGLVYTDRIEGQDVKQAMRATQKSGESKRLRFPASGPLAHFTRDGAGLLYLLWGGPASGKTTIALQAFALPHVVSGEMHLGPMAGYLARLGVTPASVSRPRWVEGELEGTGWWDLGIPPEHYGPVILDSATSIGSDVEAVLDALDAHRTATGAPVIVISQATKAGEAWGSAKIAHAVDVVVHLSREGSRRYAEATKNRAGQIGKIAFKLGAKGAERGTAPAYYSVEDVRGGGYRLVKHPDAAAKYAEPYAWVEQKRAGHEALRASFGEPGVALAARASTLSADGWAEPEDAADRRAFAEAHGLRWWSPSDVDTAPDGEDKED